MGIDLRSPVLNLEWAAFGVPRAPLSLGCLFWWACFFHYQPDQRNLSWPPHRTHKATVRLWWNRWLSCDRSSWCRGTQSGVWLRGKSTLHPHPLHHLRNHLFFCLELCLTRTGISFPVFRGVEVLCHGCVVGSLL